MDTGTEINGKVENLIRNLAQSQGFEALLFNQLVEDTSPEVSIRILARFWETLSECLVCIEQGMKIEDADQVWKACHKVAGSSELLGFAVFGRRSRQLNNDVKSIPEIDSHESALVEYVTDGRALLANIDRAFPDHKNYLL